MCRRWRGRGSMTTPRASGTPPPLARRRWPRRTRTPASRTRWQRPWGRCSAGGRGRGDSWDRGGGRRGRNARGGKSVTATIGVGAMTTRANQGGRRRRPRIAPSNMRCMYPTFTTRTQRRQRLRPTYMRLSFPRSIPR